MKVSDIHIVKTVDKSSPVLFRVNRGGPISNNVLTVNGRSFVPMPDVAKSFGIVWTPPAGGLAPGASIQLSVPKNNNAILIAQ